jgi:hypothetical protein
MTQHTRDRIDVDPVEVITKVLHQFKCKAVTYDSELGHFADLFDAGKHR